MSMAKSHTKASEAPKVHDPATPASTKTGPEHAQLAKRLGAWEAACTTWRQEGDEPTTFKGQAVFNSVFEGRFIREDFTGEIEGKELL